uniref:Uncharacterized protein n=1 Tax=Trichobilharzia regenti TaxID=157069 RepID=A0AA85JI87_TRIRE|nr:unnamed protein product [Trichobilharzia regenti]
MELDFEGKIEKARQIFSNLESTWKSTALSIRQKILMLNQCLHMVQCGLSQSSPKASLTACCTWLHCLDTKHQWLTRKDNQQGNLTMNQPTDMEKEVRMHWWICTQQTFK